MTPADIIADMDAFLASSGETVVLRRYTAPTGTPRPKIESGDVFAAVRPVRAAELVGSIDQAWSKVVLSPTGLSGLLPIKKGDKIIIQGRERNVEFPRPFEVQNTLVRIELMVSG